MMDIVGDRPLTFVLGVTPTVLEPMILGLTAQIHAAVPVMEQALLKHLVSLGISHHIIQQITINQVIPDTYKRGCYVDT
jgi:hydrogenase maturation protease